MNLNFRVGWKQNANKRCEVIQLIYIIAKHSMSIYIFFSKFEKPDKLNK